MKSTFFYFIILLVLFYSCESKKPIVSDNSAETEQVGSNMLALGFVKGTIKDFSKEEGCGYLIVLEENKQVLQP